MAEGARLESVYTGNRIEGSNPSLSAIINDNNNNFNLGWFLDFRNSVEEKSQVYSINGTSASYEQDNALTREISFITNLGYEKKITDNGKFTAGLNFKNTSQNVNSLTGNMGFKLNF